jgi:hypothetical protein
MVLTRKQARKLLHMLRRDASGSRPKEGAKMCNSTLPTLRPSPLTMTALWLLEVPTPAE